MFRVPVPCGATAGRAMGVETMCQCLQVIRYGQVTSREDIGQRNLDDRLCWPGHGPMISLSTPTENGILPTFRDLPGRGQSSRLSIM
jgi:hypothetical protein